MKTCLSCWTKKYAEFVRLLQVSGIFLFFYFSFSGWVGLFLIVPSLPIYVATVQSVIRGNQWISFISLSGLCLLFLPFTFCFSIMVSEHIPSVFPSFWAWLRANLLSILFSLPWKIIVVPIFFTMVIIQVSLWFLFHLLDLFQTIILGADQWLQL